MDGTHHGNLHQILLPSEKAHTHLHLLGLASAKKQEQIQDDPLAIKGLRKG